MSNYTKGTDFAAKDALSTGNPSKIVKGTEIDDELVAISGAISSKADLASPTFTGTPAAPTASSGTSTTQLATTAFAMGAAALVMPSGAMLQWPTASAPTGFLMCSGAAVSRTIYAALFAVIGTTFGAGDGTTTFNVPNFNNRMPIGAGDLYAVGATGGSKDAIVVSHTHTATQDAHNHLIANTNRADPGSFNITLNGSNYLSGGSYAGGTEEKYSLQGDSTAPTAGLTSTATPSISVSTTGSSGTGANLPPYLGVYFIIKT